MPICKSFNPICLNIPDFSVGLSAPFCLPHAPYSWGHLMVDVLYGDACHSSKAKARCCFSPRTSQSRGPQCFREHTVSGSQTGLSVSLTSATYRVILGQRHLSKPQPSLLNMGMLRPVSPSCLGGMSVVGFQWMALKKHRDKPNVSEKGERGERSRNPKFTYPKIASCFEFSCATVTLCRVCLLCFNGPLGARG